MQNPLTRLHDIQPLLRYTSHVQDALVFKNTSNEDSAPKKKNR